MENTYFLTRIRRTGGAWDKGTETHTDIDEARGAFHAYMGAYGYGRNEGTDFCKAYITDMFGDGFIERAKWIKPEQPSVEQA